MPQENQKEKPPVEERPGIIEAILFVAGDAVDRTELAKAMNLTEEELSEALVTLESTYNFDRRGLRMLQFGEHVQLTTRPDYAPYVEHLLQPVQRQSLSQAIMETLAVIAYKQPVTKAEVEQIRGVKCDYSIQSLTGKGLIQEAGRKEALGRPILYATTDAFLRHFCISSLDELPEIDFSKLTQSLENAEAEKAGAAAEGSQGGTSESSASGAASQTTAKESAGDASQVAAAEESPEAQPDTGA